MGIYETEIYKMKICITYWKLLGHQEHKHKKGTLQGMRSRSVRRVRTHRYKIALQQHHSLSSKITTAKIRPRKHLALQRYWMDNPLLRGAQDGSSASLLASWRKVPRHCTVEVSPKSTNLSSCAARAGVMAGMALHGDCSSFPQWGSGGAPVADRLVTGRSLGTQDHRIERAAGPGESHPADSVPGNHRSCQVEQLKPLSNQQLHEATFPSYHSEILY
jgi:hypothetical protein